MRRFGFPQAARAKSGGARNASVSQKRSAGGVRDRSDGLATACGRHSAFCAPAADEHVPKRQGHSGEVEQRKEDEQRVDVQAERVRRIIRLELIVLPPNDVVMAAPEVGRDDEGEQEGDSVLARFVLPAADGAAVRKQQQEQSMKGSNGMPTGAKPQTESRAVALPTTQSSSTPRTPYTAPLRFAYPACSAALRQSRTSGTASSRRISIRTVSAVTG